MVFQHQPWFLKEAEEENEYFNIKKKRRMPFLRAMHRAGVCAIFAGHYHRNSYGCLDGMEMITTSALGRPLGKDPSGFRVYKPKGQKIIILVVPHSEILCIPFARFLIGRLVRWRM